MPLQRMCVWVEGLRMLTFQLQNKYSCYAINVLPIVPKPQGRADPERYARL